MNRTWAFLPFVVVGVVHLAGLVSGALAVSGATKSLLMPALLVGFLVALPSRRSAVALWGTLGILFSWAGDVLISEPGQYGFILGLGGFLLAHVCYLVLFLRPLRARRVPRLALVLLFAWWLALVIVLAPHLAVLLVPVALYGLILGSSTAASLGTSRLVAAGGLAFLASDTVLAFRMFWPGFSVGQGDFLVMIAYITGQGLIAFGTVRQVRRTASRVTVVA